MSHKVVSFGEIMLRLATPGYQRFNQASEFTATYGGGEANVAVSLANYGIQSEFVTRLPKNDIGRTCAMELRKYGVGIDQIVYGGDRLGIYFLETGASQRPSKVIYDRADSVISKVKSNDFNWKEIFAGKNWFHWTGITPAISENARVVLLEALQAAKEMNLTVSCDLNFRKKMWTEKEAQTTMIPLMEYVDYCIANEEDAEKCLGFVPENTSIEDAELNIDAYEQLAKQLKEKFEFKGVAITLRESHSASRNGWSAMFLDENECIEPYRSKIYDINLVDRVGGGDSFAGGLIYGLLSLANSKEALEYAVAASCLKQTIPGDFNLVTKEEVEKLAKGSGSGRVER